jgi:hypothetical protein
MSNFYQRKHAFKFIFVFLFAVSIDASAQVGIGTTSPSASSMLDVQSTTQGFLYPRMTNTQMLAITSPANGLMVFNTDAGSIYIYNGNAWMSKEEKISKFVNTNSPVQLDNIQVRMPISTADNSLQIATVSGTITMSGTQEILYRTTATATGGSAATYNTYMRQSTTLGTTFINFWPGLDLGFHGSTQLLNIQDVTNGRAYHIIFTVGGGYNNNFISIKRLN